jgi:hypothetical protein
MRSVTAGEREADERVEGLVTTVREPVRAGIGCSVSANASKPACSTATATSLISPESSRSRSSPLSSG